MPPETAIPAHDGPLTSKTPRISFEFFPPKTAEMEATLWEAIKRLAPIVRPGGRVASVIRAADEAWFAERGIAASNIAMGQTPQSSRAGLDELVALIAAGTVAVRIDSTRPLADAGEVLAAFKSGRLSGNVVLDVAAVGAKHW